MVKSAQTKFRSTWSNFSDHAFKAILCRENNVVYTPDHILEIESPYGFSGEMVLGPQAMCENHLVF